MDGIAANIITAEANMSRSEINSMALAYKKHGLVLIVIVSVELHGCCTVGLSDLNILPC